MRHSRVRQRSLIGALSLVAALVCSIMLATVIGVADIGVADVWNTVIAHLSGASGPLPATRDAIVWEMRLPRALTATAVGAGLAVSGAILQTLTRNPLADPYLLGISSGSSFAAVTVIVLAAPLPLPLGAFLGAAGALAATLVLSGTAKQFSTGKTVLAGVAVSAMFSALTSLVVYWNAANDTYREVLNWLLGSVAGASWPAALLAMAAFVLVGVPLCFSGNRLDAFTFGTEAAAALGINVRRTQLALLAATALLTGAMVSVSGSIGFVGLVVPHFIRLVFVTSHRIVLPLSALAGGLLLLWADTFARTLFAPRELPVGVLTALIGVPIFAAVMMRNRTLP